MSKRGNGEGTIYFSDKLNRWVGQFTAGYKQDGSINRKTVYGKTRKEVAEKITAKQNEVNNKIFIDKSSITFESLARDIIDRQYKSNLLKEVSYIRKLDILRLIQKTKLAKKQIQDISISDINNTLAEFTDYSNSTINKVSILIRYTLDNAVLNKIIASNPYNIKGAIIKPKSAKLDKKVEALTIDEQKDFLAKLRHSNDYYKDVLLVALYSGMRIGEILALSNKDIDLNNNVIHVRKTLTRSINDSFIVGDTTKTYSGTRDVPMLPQIRHIFSTNQNEGLIFTKNDKLIAPTTINEHFKKICKSADINTPVNTHMLRHTFATRCIESGMSAVVLSKILGHKNIEVTLNTYTSVFNKYKNDEVDKVVQYFDAI